MSNVPPLFAPSPSGGGNSNANHHGSLPVASAVPIDNNYSNAGEYPKTATATATNNKSHYNNTTNPTAATATPPNAGLNHNLPDHIRNAANLHSSQIVAWTKLDPALAQELGRYFCFRTFGPLLLPCFWVHFLILWPFFFAGKALSENAARSQYWILTTTELNIVSLDHDQMCIPGICKSGDIVKTVPLENITDCGFHARGTGAANNCAGDVPSIYVDTASSCNNNTSEGGGHEAVGLGLENYQWFIQQVLNQRNIVKGGQGGMGMNMGMQSPPMAASMSRPDADKSAQERIAEITHLKDQGLITQQEFDQKRQEIIASI